MRKYITGLIVFCAALITIPAFAACPTCYDECDPCQCSNQLYSTAGIVNMDKAHKRSNWVVIKREKQLSEFEKLVRKAGLKNEFDKQNYTVFAPTNTAIRGMNPACLDRLKQKENKAELVKFVMAHVSKGEKSATSLCKAGCVATQNCCRRLTVSRCCHNIQVASSSIIVNDVETKNGKIHVINKVLEPYS